MSRLPFIVGGLVVILFLVYSSIFIVTPTQQAIVLRFGEITRVEAKPGIYFKVPTRFIDTVQFVDSRILRLDIDNLRVQVNDGRRYVVDAFVAFRITDPLKFRKTVSGNLSLLEANLRTRLDAALRSVYGQRSFEDALSEERLQMMLEVRDQLRPQADVLGVQIVDVRILRTDLLAEVSTQTFERMKAERLAEAAQIRARGTQASIRIKAAADREATVTIAEAQRDADILRGEGDAERNRIFADAYQRDPDFFQFYRSMKAYETGLEGNGTTMVLSPDSEFFKYFNDASGLLAASNAARSGSGAAGNAGSSEKPGQAHSPASNQ
ncbi:MAG: protease modulator HflC [Rhizobiaceae bacterium]